MASGVPRSACRAAGLTRARPLAPRQPMFATCRWSSNSNTPDAPESSHPMPPEPKVVETSADSRPRWSFTPPLAKAPFSLSRPKDPRRSEWKVNDDPAVLDRFYEGFLGPKGPEMLPEELKWQAVTHKSFDQGRRGFNDRLAYLGALFLVCCHSPLLSPALVMQAAARLYSRRMMIEGLGCFSWSYYY